MNKDIVKSLGYFLGFELILIFSWSWVLILDPNNISNWQLENFGFICAIIETSIIVLLILVFYKTENIKIKYASFNQYLFAGFIGVLFVFLQMPLNYFFNYIFGTSYNTVLSFTSNYSFNLNHLSSILLIPIIEEFVFRKLIQNKLQSKFGYFFAIIFSTFLFSLIHLDFFSAMFYNIPPNFHHSYITFFGGLVSATLFYKTKSLGPSIMMHMCWNFTVYFL